ncbi:MAG: hypothetical protein KGL39_29355 [Patescibacteria group bacterium]|nr:hypothetical protein [Patescibacteria group bacterium]
MRMYLLDDQPEEFHGVVIAAPGVDRYWQVQAQVGDTLYFLGAFRSKMDARQAADEWNPPADSPCALIRKDHLRVVFERNLEERGRA